VTGWVGWQVRRRLSDSLLQNLTILLMPFTAYLLGEIIHASGVLAVVSCGLLMSQLGPRVGRPHARQQTIAFWSLTTYVLNAALFVLIGIELQAAVRELTGAALARGLVTVAVVATVCIVVRMVWLFATVYLIRLLDRRPSQRERRTTVRARVMQGFAGFRGAVSLAAALAVPSTLATGTDFPDRDLIIFTTAGVIAVTLAQGMAFPAVVRWARLNPDGDVDEERRRRDACHRGGPRRASPQGRRARRGPSCRGRDLSSWQHLTS
jgi:monovalent cation/hydrogen antiporter